VPGEEGIQSQHGTLTSAPLWPHPNPPARRVTGSGSQRHNEVITCAHPRAPRAPCQPAGPPPPPPHHARAVTPLHPTKEQEQHGSPRHACQLSAPWLGLLASRAGGRSSLLWWSTSPSGRPRPAKSLQPAERFQTNAHKNGKPCPGRRERSVKKWQSAARRSAEQREHQVLHGEWRKGREDSRGKELNSLQQLSHYVLSFSSWYSIVQRFRNQIHTGQWYKLSRS